MNGNWWRRMTDMMAGMGLVWLVCSVALILVIAALFRSSIGKKRADAGQQPRSCDSTMPAIRVRAVAAIPIRTPFAIRATVRNAPVAIGLACTLVAGLLAAGTARVETAAPDVVLLCEPPLREALAMAGQVWRAQNHVPVRVLVASLVQNAELVRRGARADILVGVGADQMAAAQRLDATNPATLTVLGRDPIILAVLGPTSHPITLVPGAGLEELLGNGRFGLTDPAIGRAGADARATLAAIGLWPALEPRSLGAENTEALTGRLGDGSVRVAALYRSDLAGHPGLSVAATFPGEAPPVLAVLTKDVRSSHARDFLAFLRGDGAAVLQRAGLEAP